MVISQAPTRISLLGGGTDVGEYAEKHGGLVLSLAINLRQKMILDESLSVKEPRVIFHPSGGEDSFYEAFLKEFNLDSYHLQTSFDGEITGGIGSSASAAVALIGAISRYKNLNMTRDQIAEKAWDIEVNKLGLYGGKQDQYAAVYGGLNAMEFKDKVTVTPLSAELVAPILPYMMLFHTPNRKQSKIQEGLKTIDDKQKTALDFIKQSVVEGVEILTAKDPEGFGTLLKACWEAKKMSNDVTTSEVDKLYQKAIKLGAYGGKLMGSGGGGYMFFLVEPDKQFDFRKDFCTKDVKWIDFSPDGNGLETRIV